MLTLRVLVCFCILISGLLAADKPPTPTLEEISKLQPSTAAIEAVADLNAMKARAERAEITAEYWKAIAERNELAVRLLQSEAQLNEARKKIESLEKKS